jgi:hypothetical protein
MDEHQLSNKTGKDLRLKYYCRKTELEYTNLIKPFVLLENKFTFVKKISQGIKIAMIYILVLDKGFGVMNHLDLNMAG